MAYLAGSFGHPGGDLKEIECWYKSKVKYSIWNWMCGVILCHSSGLEIFQARFRMQLYRAGYLKYDSGHNLFPVEDIFHVDIDQIYESLVVFGVAPWENGLPDHEYPRWAAHSLLMVNRICEDKIYDTKRN